MELVADDVDDHAQQLQAEDAKQQQREAQQRGPDAIGAELPRQGTEPTHKHTGGIPVVVGGVIAFGHRHFPEPRSMPKLGGVIE